MTLFRVIAQIGNLCKSYGFSARAFFVPCIFTSQGLENEFQNHNPYFHWLK